SKTTLSSTSLSDVGEVKIIADEVNNALIIVATAQDYAVVHRVIEQLDVMPLQVLIDATIVEVTLKDELKYGIKWFLSHNNGGKNVASSGESGSSLFSDAATAAAVASTGGFGYAFLSNSGDIGAVLDAAATDNIANVISSPSLMVLNNQEATIQVGKEVPILTSESTNTSGGNDNVVTNTIQMRETGITLIVKPRVNANGLVIMEIDQKADDVIDTSTAGINSPSFQQRQITSTIAVQSGETIVLGGLISETDTFNKSGIPWLHKLPLIGPLFGETDKKNNKTELVVLITPRVVKTRQDARLITNEFKRKLSGIYEENIEISQP
ncbi:MAG: type II secretion system protein GspD, partial [Methylococcaceae bacterium]|nr:type II secretion system protein GspD [Methylococcaceae bacterium]